MASTICGWHPRDRQGQSKWLGVNRGQEDWKVSGKLTSEKPYHILKKKLFNIREMGQGGQNLATTQIVCVVEHHLTVVYRKYLFIGSVSRLIVIC